MTKDMKREQKAQQPASTEERFHGVKSAAHLRGGGDSGCEGGIVRSG